MVEKQWGESIENVLVFTGTKCGKPWWQWDWPRFESMWMTGGRTGGSSPLPHKCPCYQISQTILQPLLPLLLLQFSSVQSFSCVQLWPHGLQHARPPCPSSTPGVHSNSCPLSQWCHPAISSSVVPFSSCPQSYPASVSFQVSKLFISGRQSIGASASAPILLMLLRVDFL